MEEKAQKTESKKILHEQQEKMVVSIRKKNRYSISC